MMRERLDYLDNLKILLIMLVICHHLAIAFGGAGDWYLMLPKANLATHTTLTAFNAVNQAFFMSLFFFISAYFNPASYARKGLKTFINYRLVRLGIPFLVFYCLLNPLIVMLSQYLQHQPIHPRLDAGPMWFVAALLIFMLAYVFIRACKLPTRTTFRLPSLGLQLMFCILMGLLTFCLRLSFPVGSHWLFFQVGYFPLYIAFYCFGIIANRHQWLSELNLKDTRIWPWFIIAPILATAFTLFIEPSLTKDQQTLINGGWNLYALGYAIWEPFICVGMSLALLTAFKASMNFATSSSRRLSSAAYTVYIIHPIFAVIVTAIIALAPFPRLISWILACLCTIVCTFFVAHWIRKLPYFDRVL